MVLPFSFHGRMSRASYALWSWAVFFTQHLLALAGLQAQWRPVSLDWQFYVMPLRTLATHGGASEAILIAALAGVLIVTWMLTALAFRRAADAGITGWAAVFVMAPVVQVPAILALCVLPSRPTADFSATADGTEAPEWISAAQGTLAGMLLTLSAVAVGALFFGSYGYGMFVAAPFVIGTTTAYLANRTRDVGPRRTAQLVVGAAVLGGIGLVIAALEGIVCIVLASPLGSAPR